MPMCILHDWDAMIAGGVFSFMDRKAFNFYKSYYDVAKELPDEDRNEFVWAIVHAQFTGQLIEPKSKLARLMFLGQKHSILKQLVGFQTATNEAPPQAPPRGTTKAPGQQVQEQDKEQEQVQEKSIIDVGTKKENSKFIIINPKYAGEKKYRLWGVDGVSQFLEMNGSRWPRTDYCDKFLREKDGQPFDDYGHILKSYNVFIDKEFAK